MAAPSRLTSGLTQAASWQPLGGLGIPDPFFYSFFDDDFIPYNSAYYTVTAAGGSVAATVTNGSGGRALFTTGAVAGNFAEIQVPSAGFQYVASKKLAFLCRIQTSDVVNNAMVLGLINTTATPFTGGSITDGIYFSKAAASSNIIATVVTGSVVIGTVTISGLLTNATDIDLGFQVERTGGIKIFAGANLEGVKRQNTANLGPQYSIQASALTGVLTTVLLTPTLAVSNGTTAAAVTMVGDFLFGAAER